MERTSTLQQLIELARSATNAVSAELILLGDPTFQLQSGGDKIGFNEQWATMVQLPSDGAAGCNEWVRSFLAIPVTGPSAEAGWVAMASTTEDAFGEGAVESTKRIAALIEHQLDQNTERSRMDQISAALRTNQEDLQTTRDQLAAANADLEQFAYLAAHELVSPLRSVSIYAEVLESLAIDADSPLTEQTRQCTDAISQGVATMNKQIQYLLEFSRAQGIGTDLSPIDLTTVISSALDTLAEPIEEANAIIRVGDLPHVPGREVPLQSVFANLIGNAVNYRHPSRQLEIDIRSEVGNGECRITISDNGVGIDGADASRIFQLFERASTNASGTGIGLALTRRIIEAHGGEIGVEQGSTSGSVFWIDLPEAVA